MDGIWTCSQCETLNENTDICIVCGMTYQASADAVEKTIHSQVKTEPAKVRLNFPDKSVNMQTTETKQNVLSIASLLTAIKRFIEDIRHAYDRYNIFKRKRK